MKRLLTVLLASLLASAAAAQSVPNGGTITQGQVWTVPQWTAAWQSKADTASPALTGTPTIAGVPIPTYPQTAAEINAGVGPTNYTVAPCNVNRYGTNTTPGTTDMSTAIQSALSACTAVYIPAGTYLAGVTVPNTLGLVIKGDGTSTVLKQKSTGSVLSWSTASIFYSQGYVRDLAFDGTNGTAHTINTAGVGGLTLKNLYFTNTPTGFDSIFLNGVGATAMHDMHLQNIQVYSALAGNAGIEFGPLSSDSHITNYTMNGNFLVLYALELDAGALGITLNDSHPYNAASHIIYGAGSNTFLQFTHNTIDNTNGLGDLVLLAGGSNISFVGNYFEAVAGGKNAITLTNIGQTLVADNLFQALAGSGFAVSETGTSNNNLIINDQISVNGNWAAGVFNLVGAASYVCNVPGAANINCKGVPLTGTTGSIGGGALAAGACTSGTATVTGATSSMSFAVTPSANPQVDAAHGLSVWSYLSAANTVTVNVCAIIATTPNSTTYNVRVLQ